ncbi:ATP-binding protein [Massilia sp. LXY-6]|uniref:hybrid sensor histidine kinase/response regulator n=1 Tax=Massilia sp. LXY-6 TaxID=3379823 RepID=UPI003EE181C0
MTLCEGPGEVRMLLQAFDYHAAGIAPPGEWSPALRAAMKLMLDSAIPVRLAIGPRFHLFYNDSYIQFLGDRHPAALGRPYFEVWPEVRSATEPLLRKAAAGEPVFLEELPLTLNRDGVPTPAWFSYTFAPVRDDAQNVVAIYGSCISLTKQKLLEERLSDHNRKLKDMFRRAPGFMAMLRGPEHVFEFVNDANLALMGHREFVGLPARLAAPELLEQGHIELLDQVYASGEPAHGRAVPVRFDRPGGPQVRYLNFVYQPIVEPDGRVSGIFVEGSDVTEEHLSQQRTRFQVELGDEIRRAGDAFAIQALASKALGRFLGAARVCFGDYTGGDTEILFHSNYVAEGVPELIGRHPAALHGWAAPARFTADGRAVAGGMAGAQLPLASVGVPHMRGATLCSVLFVQRADPLSADETLLLEDAAARIWIAVDKAKAEAALRQADRRKDEFLAMLAHELRNPLAPISAAAALINSVPLSGVQLKRTGEVIARQVRHMGALVDDLLDVSRVTKGLVKLEPEQLEMQDIVGAAVEQARPLVQERRHTISVRVAPDALRVRGDQKRLIQVLANLLNNAAKYTPEGGEIRVSLGAHDDRVAIEVADNGIGVAPAMRERIFELFAQAERTSDRAQGGLGVGLSLVKSIVELHGGTVRCDSEGLGRGASFVVELPRVAGQPADAGAGHGAAAQAHGPLRILVVDDNADAAEMLAMYVGSLGHKVRVENSSARALLSARNVPPDVGLFDIGLPGMDGYELARRMRAQPETAGMTLVAVTGYGDRADVAAALAAGFDHHLVKPVDPRRLAEVLAEVAQEGAATPGRAA